MQLSQLESIIQQQSEQIKAQQLQTEFMNMRMSKLLNTFGPLPVPIVQTATATIPPTTEVKMTVPLSSFASASASKPAAPNQDMWEMIDQDGSAPAADAFDPVTEITGLRSPTLPPTSPAPSERGGGAGGGTPGDDPPGADDSKGSEAPGLDKKDKRGKKPPQGCRRPPGGGPGDGDDDGDDDDGDSDDSDRKFIRRMRTLFGNPKGPSSDRNKVKEADTIEVPAFPHAESYRNWRIRTREAVMSAPTNPDKAFDWNSEIWKEGQTLEVLRGQIYHSGCKTVVSPHQHSHR